MAVNEQLERILKSAPLISSPSLCRFLRYIVEETLAGRASEIKEYPLGVRVFDRGESFNPRLDPIVRVQARNLRARVAKYYEGPGAGDPIRIELPKGTYVPVFHQVTEEVRPAEAPVAVAAGAEAGTPLGVAVYVPSSVMPAPPPRSPVAESRQGFGPRFLLATVALVVILAGIAVLWITRTYAAARQTVTDPVSEDLLIRGR
jgi:hypothetical protein